MPSLSDAIRIAHRWANREGALSSSDMMVVMEALAAQPHPGEHDDPLRAAFASGFACGMDADDRPCEDQIAEAWAAEKHTLGASG